MVQFARPNTDISIGNWTDDGSGTTNLFEAINETSASDTDYVQSGTDPANDTITILLDTITDPEVSTGHIVRYRYQKNESGGGSPGTINIIVRLLQTTTTIASQTHNGISAGFTDGSFTLTGGEADNITDYSALRFEVDADKSAGARTSWAEVSWAELEVPELSSGVAPKANHYQMHRRQ